jgi:hypothetical protein
MLSRKRRIKSLGIGGESYSLFRLFQVLAKVDLYRSIDLNQEL